MWLNPNTRLFSTDDSSGHLVQVVMCFPPQNQLKVHMSPAQKVRNAVLVITPTRVPMAVCSRQ